MNWAAVTALSTAFTGLVIIATALVGVNQLAQLRAQRRDFAAVELVRSLQAIDFSRALRMVLLLPPGISSSDLHARGHEYEDAALILGFRFEMLGVLVFRRTISFEVTEQVIGGALLGVWQRLKVVIREDREAQNWPGHLEWFQWLAEQFEKRGRLLQIPAHVRHQDWVPDHPTSR
jgi:hypothetical protein